MPRCGTLYNYRQGCSCRQCKDANNAHRRKARAAARLRALLAPPPVNADAKPRPAFDNKLTFDTNLTNLRHAVTIEEWREREAADPNCRPITQPPIRLRCEALAEVHPTPSLIDGYVDGAR